MTVNKSSIQKELTSTLISKLNTQGFWDGRLSSSALAGAVSIAALHFCDATKYNKQIEKAITWLQNNINSDGGFGDTPESVSNISTSLLVYAALNLYPHKAKETQQQLATYLQTQTIDVASNRLQKTVLEHYKTDYTFSVPILAMCALCGLPNKNAFDNIPQLPFELALLPRRFYNILNLNVVSYAIPALIAVGIVVAKNKKKNAWSIIFRNSKVEAKAIKILESLLPQSGGFLEAIPLTAFVALSLLKAGYNNSNKTINKCIEFLSNTQRSDGSWAIDVDLSTWVTTLAVKSLSKDIDNNLSKEQTTKLTNHLLRTQNKTTHPFNGSMAGGWGWTHHAGSVPDCDDTPGAIIALAKLGNIETHFEELMHGVNWILNIQNSDGGFPTFSRGWGKLPFDCSCCDLTGHALWALSLFVDNDRLSPKQKNLITKSLNKAAKYLETNQQNNGSWLPLWFGNQYNNKHTNPIYGTARVLSYLKEALPNIKDGDLQNSLNKMIDCANNFIINSRNNDGSWGNNGAETGTIEETALAISAIADLRNNTDIKPYIDTALLWLENRYNSEGLKASPIGLYFASLWYDEELYPLTMYLEALSKM